MNYEEIQLLDENLEYDDDEFQRKFDALHLQSSSNYIEDRKLHNNLNQNYLTQNEEPHASKIQREYKCKNPTQYRPSTAPPTTQDQIYHQHFSRDQKNQKIFHTEKIKHQKSLNNSQMIGDGFIQSNISSNQKFPKHNSTKYDAHENEETSPECAKNIIESLQDQFIDEDLSDDQQIHKFPSYTLQSCQTTSKFPVMDQLNDTSETRNCNGTSKNEYIEKMSENKIKLLRKTQEIINNMINSEIERTDATKLYNYRRSRMQSFQNIEQEILKLKQLDGPDAGLQEK